MHRNVILFDIAFTKQTFQLLEQQWMARSIESPGRGELLLDILEIENDGHIAVEYLKEIDDLCIFGAAAGWQADIEPLGGIPHEVGAVGLRVLGVVAPDGRDALSHQLGRLIFTHGEASLDDHDGIFLERIAESIRTRGKTMTSIVPVRSSTLVKAIIVLDLVVIIRFLTMVHTIRT